MGIGALFRRKDPAAEAGGALYRAVVDQSRRPVFYRGLEVPDTLEGRFEVYALHMSLLVLRLKGEGDPAESVSQALFDAFVQGLEDGFRQEGISDTGVAKRMKKLGQAAYGRLLGYETALASLPDRSALDAFVARTIHAGGGASGPLAAYIVNARDALAAQSTDLLCGGAVEWPLPEETRA
jgi:cytochrome b pre-mRNA-processing protein 3